ncbi:3-hydroxybutyryl-CoA dehydrogenase [Halanaerobium saccharolyticum subsp. saccharolyticum DSM 6643]|uniref:3-hydroxybutyryl-CoA dehydrogenase n=1 Tax=Halanaerobium saccharolyticum subsp. saccharolyticum DSM 6643 TaxID=1293054 RepID=M5DXN2_9FIRM|nr:3-hydroxybutyryl-CoA dehydrogenase [Halanaerobium saccharolyticum]CCU77862.1 3-hydroxybutyryl-CoA dehydrogenase [Halanaerobium saccharolyticum subsp. saccharolyticum DSM 6643]
MFKKIGILGAGTMGNGIANVIAKNDNQVIMVDIDRDNLEKGYQSIEKNFNRSVKKERMTESEKEAALARITTSTKMESLSDVDLVIEAAVENLEIKKEIFTNLDEIVKDDAVLATNTSALSITEIATVTDRKDKVIGIHFFNPVPMMKLVEIIRAAETSDECYNQVSEFVASINKEAVKVNEAPGFVVNRILIPMINEAVYILQEGVASAEDIDLAMKLGANHPIGPLALADLIGLDVCLAIMETLHEELGEDKYRPCPLLRKKVRAEQLGRKTGKGFYNY